MKNVVKVVIYTSSLCGFCYKAKSLLKRKNILFDEINVDINNENRKEMIKHTPGTHFKIGPTVSMMNIWHLPDFHREWIEQGLIVKPKDVHWNILTGPEWFNIQVLPTEFKKEVDNKWRKHLCWINKNSKPNNYHSSAIKGVLTYMNSADKSHLLPTTIDKLDFTDKVRNETWQETFPELSWLIDYKN